MDNLSAVESIFYAALDKATTAERAAYLEQACGADAALRRAVERLLIAHPNVGDFLQTPALAGAAEEPPISEGPGVRVGPYKLLQQIGEGGMGTVYLAEQQEPVRRLVALKLVKAGMDSAQILARFEQERQALALMDHPNVAKVLDAGATAEGRPYFVMELVRGVPITTYCDENRLGLRERLELFIPVCLAVQHAHQKGVIHRDLKPSNVLVALYDGKPVPKVIDFGVAKAQGGRLTARTLCTGIGAIVGTLEYMSPEQAELSQLDIDTRSDVYSLGALLYELLTGSTPLDRERLKEGALLAVLRLIREEEPPKPSVRLKSSRGLPTLSEQRGSDPAKLVRRVRGELDWIVMRALEKDRGRRYQTADGLARDIQRFLRDEPIEAGPPSAGYRLRKFVKRNRGALLAGTLVLLTFVGGVIGTMVGLKRAWDIEGEFNKIGWPTRNAQHADQLKQALLAWERDDVAGAERLLDKMEDAFQQTWEQRYLRALCRREVGSMHGHTDQVVRVVFSADGRRMASWSYDGTVKVWDTATGQLIRTLQHAKGPRRRPKVDEAGPREVAPKGPDTGPSRFAVSQDSPLYIALGNEDESGTVTIWNLSSGPLPERKVTSKKGQFRGRGKGDVNYRIEFHGGSLALGNSDGTVSLCNPWTGEETHVLKGVFLALSHLGWCVATRGEDGTVTVWHCGTGKEKCTLPFAKGQNLVALSSGGEEAVVEEGISKMVGAWYTTTGQKRFTLGQVTSAVFDPSGSRIAAIEGGRVKVWNLSGQEGPVLDTHPPRFEKVAFSPNGQCIVGTGRGEVRVWNAHTGKEMSSLTVSSNEMLGVTLIDEKDLRVVVGDQNGAMKLLGGVPKRLETHTLEALLYQDNPQVALSPDGKRIVTAEQTGVVIVWDAATGEKMGFLHPGGTASSGVPCVAWSPESKSIVAACSYLTEQKLQRTVQTWDVSKDEMTRTITFSIGDEIAVALSADGERLATRKNSSSADTVVTVWNTATGRQEFEIKTGVNPAKFAKVAFSPLGPFIVTGTSDGSVTVWDMATGQKKRVLRGFFLAFSQDGRGVATRGADSTIALVDRLGNGNRYEFIPKGNGDSAVTVWDIETGAVTLRLNGRAFPVSAAFSPDGKRIVTGNGDGTMTVWDVVTGQEKLTLRSSSGAVTSVLFSQDGQRLVTSHWNSPKIMIWDAPMADPHKPVAK
jgi:WD40 repeat protein/serine/threonine protein kinase